MLRTHRFSVLLTLYFFGSLMESLYALTAKEMVLSGDWISPQVFGSFWYDKPPFMYWLLSASYSVFGFSNFASRLPAAFCGALSVSFMAWYVRRILNDETRILNDETAAVWAAAFLATALEFWVISHAVITDSALFLFAIPTFFSGYIGVKEKSWKHITIAWAAAALACLTKGPVGLVLPGAILFLWCLSIRSFGGLARLFFPAGILVFLLIAGPWYYTMYDIHGQAFIDQFFGLHNVTRALSSEHPEDNYFFYYLVLLPVALLPWTGLSFYTMAKKWKEKTDLYKFLMIACWGTVLFYTLVATKYVTYTYIAVAPAVFLAVLALEQFPLPLCHRNVQRIPHFHPVEEETVPKHAHSLLRHYGRGLHVRRLRRPRRMGGHPLRSRHDGCPPFPSGRALFLQELSRFLHLPYG